ncbi:MAG: AMP-dependent synthetase/ligase [Rhodospirillales bacterium]
MDYRACRSLPAMLFEQAAKGGDGPALWAKEGETWQALTWSDLASRVRALAKVLIARGVEPGQRILLVCENRPEWVVAHFAIMSAGAITVPAYTTNTERDHQHLLQDSGACGAVLSSAALGERFLPAAVAADDCRFVIALEDQGAAPQGDLDLFSWSAEARDAAASDAELDARLDALERDAACIFIYTSGTGGTPKGVMLSHANVLANCIAAFDLLRSFGIEAEQQTFLSFLPLSHSYEHATGLCFALSIGAQIYYAQSVEQLAANMAEVKPTLMTAVPRLYESMYQRIVTGLKRQPALKQKLFHRAVTLGSKRHAGESLSLAERVQDRALERLVRAKVRERFGGRLQALVSGGAALNPDIGRIFQALGLVMLQGYGQTEASPVVSCNRPDNVKMASVGPPLEGVEVRIAEDGEILVRGDNVMLGYWNDPEATAAAIRDGWLHTGDVGHLDEQGCIYITDRKKDIIVLSGGDNVSPARLEGLLTMEAEIEQAFVWGDRQPYLVALIVPTEACLESWAKEKGVADDRAALASDSAFQEHLGLAVGRMNEKVSVVERIRRFILAPEPFTIDNEMMTPTMKNRRHKILATYGAELSALYPRKKAAE